MDVPAEAADNAAFGLGDGVFDDKGVGVLLIAGDNHPVRVVEVVERSDCRAQVFRHFAENLMRGQTAQLSGPEQQLGVQRLLLDVEHIADEAVYVSREYHDGCMLECNRYLVDHAACLLAVYNGEWRGGTAMTVRYVKRLGREVILLNPV